MRRPRRGKNAKDAPPSEPTPQVTPEMRAAFGEYLDALSEEAVAWIRRQPTMVRSFARRRREETAARGRDREQAGSHADPNDGRYSPKRPYSPHSTAETLAAHAAGRPDNTASSLRESRAAVGRLNLRGHPTVRERGIEALGRGLRAYSPEGYGAPIPKGYHAAQLRAEFDGQAAILLKRARAFYGAARVEFPGRVEMQAALLRQKSFLARVPVEALPAGASVEDITNARSWAVSRMAPDEREPNLLPSRLRTLAGDLTRGLQRVLDLAAERAKPTPAQGICSALRLSVAVGGLRLAWKGSRLSTTERALDFLSDALVDALYDHGPARAALEAVAYVLGRSVGGIRKAAARGARVAAAYDPKPVGYCAKCGVGHYFRPPGGRWRCWWCAPPDRRRRPTQMEILEVRLRAADGPASHGDVLAWSTCRVLTPAEAAELIAATLRPARK